MLDEKQRHILEAVVQVLAVAGIHPWFEARLIKDSSKKLNGKRISSKTKTDLASVLRVADEKRVNMLPNYRMELRMYATVGASRSVFMGQEQVDEDPFTPDPPPVDEVVELPKGKPIHLEVPLLGVLNVDNPRDPRHQEWGKHTAVYEPPVLGQEPQPVYLEGRANYSPAKNVERLIAEGASEALIRHAQDRHTIKGTPANPDAPLAGMRTVAEHTCDADGPMRQQESDGPFLPTCSLCGEINAGTT